MNSQKDGSEWFLGKKADPRSKEGEDRVRSWLCRTVGVELWRGEGVDWRGRGDCGRQRGTCWLTLKVSRTSTAGLWRKESECCSEWAICSATGKWI